MTGAPARVREETPAGGGSSLRTEHFLEGVDLLVYRGSPRSLFAEAPGCLGNESRRLAEFLTAPLGGSRTCYHQHSS
jgi:hypothetical protein